MLTKNENDNFSKNIIVIMQNDYSMQVLFNVFTNSFG